MEAYLLIDYTNDFVADEGSMTLGKKAQDLAPNIIRHLEQALEEGNLVVFATDAHYEGEDHPENELFPPHNIVGTWGRQLYEPVREFYRKYQEVIVALNKTRYSAFYHTDLHSLLQAYNIEKIHILGVCTDICVLQTVADAYYYNYEVCVMKDSILGTSDQAQEYSLEYMKNMFNAKIYEEEE